MSSAEALTGKMVPSNQKVKLGLTLSGGGFRATLFHLGVVRYLHEVGVLKEVTHICSVSGGSVLAAYLVLHWDKFCGTAAQFEEAAREIIAFTVQDVRGKVFRRCLCARLFPVTLAYILLQFLCFGLFESWARFLRGVPLVKRLATLCWSLTHLLQREYDRLFPGKTCSQFPESPELYVLATSMDVGDVCAFSRLRISVGLAERSSFPAGNFKVSQAVAASSALPSFFPPVVLEGNVLEHGRVEGLPLVLTDGGVYDNLGMEKLQALWHGMECDQDGIIVSDAGAALITSQRSRYSRFWSRTARASDILMSRVTKLENDTIHQARLFTLRLYMPCRITATVPHDVDPKAMDVGTQQLVAQLRTDLDAFSPLEADRLIKHGYAVARHAWFRTTAGRAAGVDFTSEPWSPIERTGLPHEPNTVDDQLRRGAYVRTLAWLGNLQDPVTYGIWILVVCYLLLLGWFIL